MNAPPDDDVAESAALFREIRDVLDVLDPMPDDLTTRAKFAISARTLEAELAELTTEHLIAVRGAAAPTSGGLFTAAGGSVVVELAPDVAGGMRIDGWVSDGPADIEAYAAHDPLALATRPPVATAATDEAGRFDIVVPGGAGGAPGAIPGGCRSHHPHPPPGALRRSPRALGRRRRSPSASSRSTARPRSATTTRAGTGKRDRSSRVCCGGSPHSRPRPARVSGSRPCGS